MWLLTLFGILQVCSFSAARISALPIQKDFVGYGTQYRFQYFVRDERGDYKTQEEAGEGGSARGSYAVEEPDGDLRIVQYTADLDGGFKAHIKVDHAGGSPSTLQKIEIPPEEMQKLIAENSKKKIADEPKPPNSKSYELGPPKSMSDIVMEQAAAIREIISKEIEAEHKREKEIALKAVKRKAETTDTNDVVPGESHKIAGKEQYILNSRRNNGTSNTEGNVDLNAKHVKPLSVEKLKDEDTKGTTANENKADPSDNLTNEATSESHIASLKDKDSAKVVIQKSNTGSINNDETLAGNNDSLKEERDVLHDLNQRLALPNLRSSSKLLTLSKEQDSVRDVNSKAKISSVFKSNNSRDPEKSISESVESAADIRSTIVKSSTASKILSSAPIPNESLKNQISMHKVANQKVHHGVDSNLSEERPKNPQNPAKPTTLSLMLLNGNVNSKDRDFKAQKDDRILLYSLPQQTGQQGDNQKAKFVTIPYSVLKPYLTENS